MTLEIYTAYIVACFIVLLIPGPTVMLVVSYALAQGRRSALATVSGVGLGDATGLALSLIGLGAVMATSALLFTVLKWIGALYLVWLGIKLWRTEPEPLETVTARENSSRQMFFHAWIVTALNPKAIAFYLAFMPQFVVAGAPVAPQLMVLGITFVVLGVVNAALYAWLASQIRARLTRPGPLRVINRIGGSVLIGAGIMTAAIRRTA